MFINIEHHQLIQHVYWCHIYGMNEKKRKKHTNEAFKNSEKDFIFSQLVTGKQIIFAENFKNSSTECRSEKSFEKSLTL